MAIVNQLLTEKVRPRKLEHIILSKRIKSSIGKGDLSQHMLLVGQAGTGKTSLAKILAKGRSTLYLNVSEQRGIQIIRDQIMEFAATKQLSKLSEKNDFKVVILDEIDGATSDFFQAMRATMEKFHKNVRFIATCNYINKIPDPIQSRFLVIKFDSESKEEEKELINLYKKRISHVTQKLGMEWESEETLNIFVKKYFPDLRRIFSKVQDFSISNVETITLDVVQRMHFTFRELYELIISKPNPYQNYKLIMTEYNNKVDDVFASLNNEFIEWLKETKPQLESKLPIILVTIPDWEFKSKSLIDPSTALLACILQLQQTCNS